jgi:hypothetical protein
MQSAPEIMEVDSTQLEEVLHRAEQVFDEEDATLVRAVFKSYTYVTDLVEDKNTSLRRLCQLFFGARTEKTKAAVAHNSERPNSAAEPNAESTADKYSPSERVKPNTATAHVEVPHLLLTASNPFPTCGQGSVYEEAPGVLMRITRRPSLAAKIQQSLAAKI